MNAAAYSYETGMYGAPEPDEGWRPPAPTYTPAHNDESNGIANFMLETGMHGAPEPQVRAVPSASPPRSGNGTPAFFINFG